MRSLPLVWVLNGRLALGPAPRQSRHWLELRHCGIASVVSLCELSEGCAGPPASGLALPHWSAWPLPDARSQRQLSPRELLGAIQHVRACLHQQGPVYLHCRAGLERSPLVALGVVCQELGWDFYAGLAYLRRVHPAAQPTLQQLAVLEPWLADPAARPGPEVACA